MIRGVRVSEKFDYISEYDDAKSEEEGATIWELGTLPVDIRTKIQDGVVGFHSGESAQGITLNNNRQNLEAVRFGLKGVRNFSDEEGKPIKFETEEVMFNNRTYTVPTFNFLTYIDTRILNELGKKVIGVNAMTGQERKN